MRIEGYGGRGDTRQDDDRVLNGALASDKERPERLCARFGAQVSQAARNVSRRYNYWPTLALEELRQEAICCLLGYDESGELAKWQAETSGSRNQLDRYVLQALNCDLVDWARERIASARHEVLAEPEDIELTRSQIEQDAETAEDNAIWVSWPLLEMKFRQGMSVQQIADELGIDVRTVRRRTDKEMSEAREAYR